MMLHRLARAVVETVTECEPATETLIHLALQSSLGMTHAHCTDLINALIAAGFIQRDANYQLSVTAKGKTI